MARHAIRNGKLILEEEALAPVTCREVQCGFYVYEALRIIGRHIVHLDDHIARLENSASQIGLSLPKADWRVWIDSLIEADDIVDATMRIQVYGGSTVLSFITWQTLLSYPDSYYSEGVAVTTYEGERFLPACKTGNLLLSYLALNDAHDKGAFEALLVDRRGRVLEGTRSNFFALRGRRLFSAPDEEVLSGITRISVLRAAKELGLEIVMEAPSREDLYSFDALFISSTSMGAMPVTKLDGRQVVCDIEMVGKICRLVRAWETA